MTRRRILLGRLAGVCLAAVAAGAALPALAGTTLVDGVLTFDTSSDGKSLQLRYAAGTMVIFR